MEKLIKFRGKRKDGKGWVYGFYRMQTFYNRFGGDITEVVFVKHFIGCLDNLTYFDGIFEQVEIIPETLGQLRYIKDDVEYYDGDIYYHAGYGDETVSDLCELQMALITGNSEDICHIKGNIHDKK